MDTIALVDRQIQDGEKLLERLSQAGIPVRAAGWVKLVDEDRWSLDIVTPLVDEIGPLRAYGEVYGHLRSLGDLWITDSDVKLLRETHPVGLEILKLLQHGSKPLLPLFGGSPAEDIHVYGTIKNRAAEKRPCIPVAYIYRRDDRPGSTSWHRNSRIIAPSPSKKRPGFMHLLEDTDEQVTLIFAVPCDEQGAISSEAQEEYEDRANEMFNKLRPTEELA